MLHHRGTPDGGSCPQADLDSSQVRSRRSWATSRARVRKNSLKFETSYDFELKGQTHSNVVGINHGPGPVPVVYDPDNPDTNTIDNLDRGTMTSCLPSTSRPAGMGSSLHVRARTRA
jgi:hypothetical protein